MAWTARALLQRVIAWAVAARYYVFAVLFYPLTRLAGAALQRIVLGDVGTNLVLGPDLGTSVCVRVRHAGWGGCR
jgi:hypothetical protein